MTQITTKQKTTQHNTTQNKTHTTQTPKLNITLHSMKQRIKCQTQPHKQAQICVEGCEGEYITHIFQI